MSIEVTGGVSVHIPGIRDACRLSGMGSGSSESVEALCLCYCKLITALLIALMHGRPALRVNLDVEICLRSEREESCKNRSAVRYIKGSEVLGLNQHGV